MTEPYYPAPIDDEALTDRVIAAALAAPRDPLIGCQLPRTPGGYLFFLCPVPDPETDPLREFGALTLGRTPFYAGAAAELAGRMRRYLSNESLGGSFHVARIWVAAIPTRTLAGALLVEGTVATAWRIPGSDPALRGIGSRNPGHGRLGHQGVAPWGRLHPRTWEGRGTPTEVCATRLALASRVLALPTSAPRWPPLPSFPSAADSPAQGRADFAQPAVASGAASSKTAG